MASVYIAVVPMTDFCLLRKRCIVTADFQKPFTLLNWGPSILTFFTEIISAANLRSLHLLKTISKSSLMKMGPPDDSAPQGKGKIRVFQFIIARYLWPILLLAAFLFSFFSNPPITVGPFTSANISGSLSKDEEPFFFVQVSDLHIHHLRPERTERIISIFRNISDVFNPPLGIITGDLVDASNSTAFFTHYEQFQGNWDSYLRVRNESGFYSSRRIIELSGNHDIMSVLEDTKQMSDFRKYCINDSDPFIVRSFEFNSTKLINIIVFNPLQPPFQAGVLGLMPYASSSMLDSLESVIKNNSVNIVAVHFPFTSLWSGRSKSGKDVHQILEGVNLVISGHTHPANVQLSRRGNSLTAIAPAMRSYTQFGVATIDNGMVSYHQRGPDRASSLIVTYPLPMSQLTSKCVFNLKSFPVKVLQFGSNKTIHLEVDNVSVGNMSFAKKLADGVFLHYLEISAGEGNHSLRVDDGQSSEVCEFFIGDSISGKDISTTTFSGPVFFIVVFVIASILSYLTIIPWWKPIAGKLDRFEDYMEKSADNNSKWWESFYIGPLVILSRLRKTPTVVYATISVLILWDLAIPLYFTQIEGYVAAAWLWGVLADSKFTIFCELYVIGLIYLVFMCVPLILMAQIWWETDLLSAIHYIEFAFSVAVEIFGLFIWVCIALITGKAFCALTSPMTFLPIISSAILFVWMPKAKAKKDETSELLIKEY